MRRGRLSLGFTVAALLPIALLFTASLLPGGAGGSREPSRYEPVIDIQKEMWLTGGERRVSLAEATRLAPYRVPTPVTNAMTGSQTAVWIDKGAHMAFVWGTDLRFYIHPAPDLIEAELVAGWTSAAQTQPDFGSITLVRGHTAVGVDGKGEEAPSSLSWMENNLLLQFVAPNHTLDQLRQLAEQIT
jgi:hypothetical protein